MTPARKAVRNNHQYKSDQEGEDALFDIMNSLNRIADALMAIEMNTRPKGGAE